MSVLTPTVNQMLVLFLFMALGYLLRKKKLLPENAATVLAKLETNVLVPCLVFNTFNTHCTVGNFEDKWTYILYGAAIMVLSLVIAIPLSHAFTKESYKRRIYNYSFAVANFSFMGNAVVLGIFGTEVLFDYMMLTMPLNLYVYSYGVASLEPDGERGRFSLRTLINPICIAMLAGIVCGLTGVFELCNQLFEFPVLSFLSTAISSAGACMSPLAMILTGFVIGGYSFRMLASDKKIYFVSFLRLIVIPAAFVLALRLIGADSAIICVALCATAMPLGLNTVVIPAAHGGDTVPGASMALISHLLSIVTIPVMFAILL